MPLIIIIIIIPYRFVFRSRSVATPLKYLSDRVTTAALLLPHCNLSKQLIYVAYIRVSQTPICARLRVAAAVLWLSSWYCVGETSSWERRIASARDNRRQSSVCSIAKPKDVLLGRSVPRSYVQRWLWHYKYRISCTEYTFFHYWSL